MAEIKLIEKDTDLSILKSPIGWDFEVKGLQYDIYNIHGYNHTLGGRWGENSYWACPADEIPTYENLVAFNGEAPTWGIIFEPTNYFCSKWEGEWRSGVKCFITRNGKQFYDIMARDMDYALAKAQYNLVQLLESCPLNLNMRNWKEEAIGWKLWYEQQPAIISRITSDNCLMLTPDGIDKFAKPVYWDTDDYFEHENDMKVDLLDGNIYWFRK